MAYARGRIPRGFSSFPPTLGEIIGQISTSPKLELQVGDQYQVPKTLDLWIYTGPNGWRKVDGLETLDDLYAASAYGIMPDGSLSPHQPGYWGRYATPEEAAVFGYGFLPPGSGGPDRKDPGTFSTPVYAPGTEPTASAPPPPPPPPSSPPGGSSSAPVVGPDEYDDPPLFDVPPPTLEIEDGDEDEVIYYATGGGNVDGAESAPAEASTSTSWLGWVALGGLGWFLATSQRRRRR